MRRSLDQGQDIRGWIPRTWAVFGAVLGVVALGCGDGPEAAPRGEGGGDTVGAGAAGASAATPSDTRVRPGIQVLLDDSLHLVRGRRVGLVTNHTGVYWERTGPEATPEETVGHVIDALHGSLDVELVALFAPEHGIRGAEEAGARIETEVDERTGVTVHSLYGDTRRPTRQMLEDVDVLVFDMQDVGARYYTYVSTMSLAMEAAGDHGIPFVVLDRPNPIRGDVVQGNVLDPAFATFVGLYPVPMRHGMTPGELARLYVGEFGVDVELHVVPADGWRRDMTYGDTGLPWVPPSPNMPSVESALAYPGTCLFEGTPLSVGRGTDRAFQWVGAPWLDGEALADTLNGYGFEGVRFEAATFTPDAPGDGKFDGVSVGGVRLVGTTSAYDAPRAAVAMLVEARRMSGDRWAWRESHFDRLAGTDELRLGIDAGLGLDELTTGWDTALAEFEDTRTPYFIYE
ncbi:MAG: DUF1343 domain-containing protein [Longimicrobiales bacterium]|nr:DUF1343 domain-containing protein [Longimicrobiales bacterium]